MEAVPIAKLEGLTRFGYWMRENVSAKITKGARVVVNRVGGGVAQELGQVGDEWEWHILVALDRPFLVATGAGNRPIYVSDGWFMGRDVSA